MTNEDVQDPEYVINGMGHDGKIRKVPFLFQREGETWEGFCERMRRVSDALNNELVPQEKSLTTSGLITIILFYMLMGWAVYELVLWFFS